MPKSQKSERQVRSGRKTSQPAPRSSDHVQSLARGLAVIRAFSCRSPDLTLTEVAATAKLHRATARRFLLTLAQLGYVNINVAGRTFSLATKALELGYSYLSSLTLPEVAEPHLQHLVHEVHESSSVAVFDRGEVIYVARVATERIMSVFINIGTRFPAHLTSMGRVLLGSLTNEEIEAYLASANCSKRTPYTITDPNRLRKEIQKARSQVYALVDQELEVGLRSIAVPISNPSGNVIAAINISTHISRTSVAAMRKVLLPRLMTTRRSIEGDLASFVHPRKRPQPTVLDRS
jgi:IclR family pca regulon transcriptional regulator